ncbi:MAG: hypothetical protein HC843_13625 [Sphingomonadales bacterium]|nr:hypothetical protein [Sphingomonadales bacterium]
MLGFLWRLPAIVYFIVSAALVIGGIAMFFTSRSDDAARSAALKHKPPAEVLLDNHNPATYKSDYDEIVLRAQANPAAIMEEVRTKRSREVGRTVYMPLYPVAAKSPDQPATAVAIMDEAVSDEQLAALVVGEGNFGPIMLIDGIHENGTVGDGQKAREVLARAATLSPNVTVVKPFINGRKADLAPKQNGIAILIGALVAALLSAGYGFYRRQSEYKSYDERGDGYQA